MCHLKVWPFFTHAGRFQRRTTSATRSLTLRTQNGGTILTATNNIKRHEIDFEEKHFQLALALRVADKTTP